MTIKIIQFSKEYEKIIYMAGRGCYNLDINTPDKEYITRLIKNNHTSVLEHIYITIQFKNVSRAFMAQITRHRLASFSITSQHYSDYSNMPICDFISNSELNEIKKFFNKSKQIYSDLLTKGFSKEIARYCLTEAASTNIIMSANVREWRLILNQRCASNNVTEMKTIMIQCLKLFYNIMPKCFNDLMDEYVKLH